MVGEEGEGERESEREREGRGFGCAGCAVSERRWDVAGTVAILYAVLVQYGTVRYSVCLCLACGPRESYQWQSIWVPDGKRARPVCRLVFWATFLRML